MKYIPTTHHFVCVLSKNVPTGKAMNALGHMAAGLIPLQNGDKELRFQTYVDADGGEHPSISDCPFIVLRAKNSNQIRTLRQQLLENDINFTDFTSIMSENDYAFQHDKMNNTAEEDLEYYGICFFTEATQAKALTKKYSLYN